MAVARGDLLIFQLEHETGTEECAVAREALLDLARRDREGTSPQDLHDILATYRDRIESVALAKLRKGEYSTGGILVTSKDLFP